MRLFIGIPLEGSLFKPEQDLLRRSADKGSFSDLGNTHLTIAFLGETPEALLPVLKQMVLSVKEPAFTLSFTHWGHFGSTWFIAPEENEILSGIQGTISDALLSEGIPFDNKPFHPHVTMARNVLLDRSVRLANPAIEMQAESLVLFHSQLGEKVIHTPLATCLFAPC